MKICSEAGLLPRVARRNVSSIDNCYWTGNFDDFDYSHLKLTLNWAYHMKACAEEIQNECKTERSTSWTMEKVTHCKESTKKSATPWREKYVAQSSKKSAMKSSPSKVLRVLLCECKGTPWEICHEEPLQECVLEFNEVCSTEDDEECHNVPAHPALNFIEAIPAIQFWKSCDCSSTIFSSWWATFLLQRHQEGWETQHQINRTNLSLPAVLLNSSSNELSVG